MALSKKPLPIDSLGLPAALAAKLADFGDTGRFRLLRPEVIAKEWKITPAQWERINKALVSRGQEPLPSYVAPEKPEPRAASLKGLCRKPVTEGTVDNPCGRKLFDGKRACLWHWLADQPIELQVEKADQRRRIVEDGFANDPKNRGLTFMPRPRVPESEWPDGERWCSECQMFVPFFYCSGSKCKAHASRAAHAGMVERVYQISREEYDRLLAWQGGRCYICQQVPRVRRLAVDHDHDTNEVRGLLCANDEWGCNVLLRRLLGNLEMAKAAVRYVEKHPLQRMRDGEPPVTAAKAPPAARGAIVRAKAAQAATRPARTENDPFKGFL